MYYHLEITGSIGTNGDVIIKKFVTGLVLDSFQDNSEYMLSHLISKSPLSRFYYDGLTYK